MKISKTLLVITLTAAQAACNDDNTLQAAFRGLPQRVATPH